MTGIAPEPVQRGRPKGTKAGFSSQLSELQKLILLWMLSVEQACLKSENEELLIMIRNRGIPWDSSEFVEAWWMPWVWHTEIRPAGPSAPALSRALHRLEDRELITAQAEGRGRNRRITHLKFSAPARAIAVQQQAEQLALREVEEAISTHVKRQGIESAEEIERVTARIAEKYGPAKAIEMHEAGLKTR